MTFKPYAAEVKAITAVLESEEYEDAPAMAGAVLAKAWELFTAKRHKFVVAAQLIETPPGVAVDATVKVALGPFATKGNATAAGESLALSTQTGERYRWWCLPIHHGSPAEWHAQRKKVYQPETPEGRLEWVEKWESSRSATE